MSYAVDAVTGQTIRRGEEVVALVIDRRTGGYPDATTHAAMHTLSPSDLFEPVSLPIRAAYDEFGAIVPAPRQIAVSLLLDLANQSDWKSFQEKAFGVDGGIVLGAAARGPVNPLLGDPDGARTRVLGLAIYRKATWEHLLATSPLQERKAEVDLILSRIAEVRATNARGELNAAWRNINLLDLRQSTFHRADGSSERLPWAAHALEHREGGSSLGRVAADAITRRGGVLGHDLLDRDADAETRRAIEAVWDLRAAEAALQDLGKTYQPSPLARGTNATRVFGLALTMMREATRTVVARCEDWPEAKEGVELAALMEQARALQEELSAALSAARGAAEADGPRGPSR